MLDPHREFRGCALGANHSAEVGRSEIADSFDRIIRNFRSFQGRVAALRVRAKSSFRAVSVIATTAGSSWRREVVRA